MAVLRKILFYIFTAIYIVFCPLVILYAMGYIYRPGMEKGVVKTGLIAVASSPSHAEVYMNKSRYSQLSPAVINELLPGEYSIQLELEGYQKWDETVPVVAEKATVLDRIILIPLKWTSKVFLPEKVKGIIPFPGSDFFLIQKGLRLSDLVLAGCKEEKYWPLIKGEAPFKEFKPATYFFIENSSSGILRGSTSDGEKVIKIVFAGEENKVKDITGLFPKNAQKVKWEPQSENKLFIFQDGSITRVELDTGAVYPKYVSGVKGYGLSGGKLYVITSENLFVETDYENTGKNVLLDDEKLGKKLFGQTEYFDIKAVADDTFLFLGENGELLSNRLPYRFADGGIRGVKCAADSPRVLIWNKNKVGILDFGAEETQKTAFEKGPSLRWVHMKGSNIRQAFWVYKESHVLFVDQNKVFLLGIEEFEGFKAKQIFSIKSGSSLYFSDTTGKVYYVGSLAKDGVSFGEIVSSSASAVIPFPQIEEKNREKQSDEK
ncbi:MAG: PEGA domain-containing protein [Candidatus Omnitrophica bacterium]|nr:PEGA domain-containing protein [Candidatus Omnitrophota bacterium]